MEQITTAVFPVAGFGTRFLPATKAMPKELLPIIEKPLIQYAVEEAILAGINTLIFVTGRNKRAIEDHFDSNQELEAALQLKGKKNQAEMIRNILPPDVECIFVRQSQQLGLGHAILCAERAVGRQPFAVLLADDFITFDGSGVVADLVKSFEKTGNNQLSVMEVLDDELSKYGVVVPGEVDSRIAGLIEKPLLENAPSRLASVGRYVLTPEIFDILRIQEPGTAGEIQLADAINVLAKRGLVEAVRLNGKRFDCGSIEGYLKAIIYKAEALNLL